MFSVSEIIRRCTGHRLHCAMLLAILLAQCCPATATARSDMLIGYTEGSDSPINAEIEDCADRMSEQICNGYKESGMCSTGEAHGFAIDDCLHAKLQCPSAMAKEYQAQAMPRSPGRIRQGLVQRDLWRLSVVPLRCTIDKHQSWTCPAVLTWWPLPAANNSRSRWVSACKDAMLHARCIPAVGTAIVPYVYIYTVQCVNQVPCGCRAARQVSAQYGTRSSKGTVAFIPAL